MKKGLPCPAHGKDKDAVMKALQDIYWDSKARNVEKYTPKKYKLHLDED